LATKTLNTQTIRRLCNRKDNEMNKETKFVRECKCGMLFDFIIGSPTGCWWFTCGRCGKYYWKGLRGLLGVVSNKCRGKDQ